MCMCEVLTAYEYLCFKILGIEDQIFCVCHPETIHKKHQQDNIETTGKEYCDDGLAY